MQDSQRTLRSRIRRPHELQLCESLTFSSHGAFVALFSDLTPFFFSVHQRRYGDCRSCRCRLRICLLSRLLGQLYRTWNHLSWARKLVDSDQRIDEHQRNRRKGIQHCLWVGWSCRSRLGVRCCWSSFHGSRCPCSLKSRSVAFRLSCISSQCLFLSHCLFSFYITLRSITSSSLILNPFLHISPWVPLATCSKRKKERGDARHLEPDLCILESR